MTTPPASPLDHALAYARLGWRVAPIPPGYKHPHGIDNWQRKATTDRERITRWWTTHPTHGVCIATGPDSGVIAIDIDPRHGGDDGWHDLETTFGPAPDTAEAITGGGGRHLLYRHPTDGPPITNAAAHHLPPGIDVRGDGGQIVAAPTIHPDTHQPYTWEIEHDPLDGYPIADIPPWLLELLTRPAVDQKPRAERTPRPPGSDLPGDLFAAAHTWPELLNRHGWSFHSRRAEHGTGELYELWTRPGKATRQGASASLYYKGSDVLKVFTTGAAPLEAEQTYTKFGFWTALEHGGDHAAAARELRRATNAAGSSDNRPPKSPADERPPAAGPPDPPSIVWNGRQLDDVVAAGIDALVAHNQPPSMFVRAGALARVRQDEDDRPIIETMRAGHIRLALADAANWYRTTKEGERTATSPPLDVAAGVGDRGHWPLPGLTGVVELPVLRPDGTFATDHGYDPATRLYHWHRGRPYPTIPNTPTASELTTAVALIDDILADFPWDNWADRANAWGLLLTPLVRPLVNQVPMALVDAPEPGTGKGLLIQVAALVTIGRAAALMAWPATDEELEKKLTAALMAGTTMMIFDNVEGMIKSPTLAAVLTADTWQGRVLGRSEMATVPNRATWACTGNNIDVGGDLARRCYRIRLDARQAQPWKRTGFRHPDLANHVATNRGAILHALCTIVRSWWTAGRPLAGALAAMGGYTSWVRTVGGILEHAGIAGFLANLAEFHADADREARAWETYLAAWSETFGERAVTVAELINRMDSVEHGATLREALPEDLSGYRGTAGFSRRLSLALRKRTGRHYGDDGMHLVEMPRDRRQVAIYAVTSRPITLFPADDLLATPARPEPTTRTDTQERGSRGSSTLATRGENLSTGTENGPISEPTNSRDSRTPAPTTELPF